MAENKKIAEPQESGRKWIGIIAGLFAFLTIIVLIVVYINSETFPLWQLIMWCIIAILVFVGGFFIFNYFQSKKNEKKEEIDDKKLPPAISMEQAREIALNAVQNPIFADYIPSCLHEQTYDLGKNRKNAIYVYVGKGKYENGIYVILINMHYPNTHRAVIPMDISEDDFKNEKMKYLSIIKREAMMLSTDPEDEKAPRIIVNENPLLGTRQTIHEPLPENDNKEEKKKEEEE